MYRTRQLTSFHRDKAPQTAHAHDFSFPIPFSIELFPSPRERPRVAEDCTPAGVTGCAKATGVALPEVLVELLLDMVYCVCNGDRQGGRCAV